MFGYKTTHMFKGLFVIPYHPTKKKYDSDIVCYFTA